MSLNTFNLVGSVIDPNLTYTSDGFPVLEMTIGVRQESPRTEVSYTRAKVFGKRAESLLQQLEDNDSTSVVYLEGRFDQYQNDKGQIFNSMNVTEALVLDASPTFWQDSRGNDLLKHGQNILTISGNLTKDVQVRELESGQVVVNGTIAYNRVYKGKKSTVFLRFNAWNGKAEVLKEALKGAGFILKGSVTTTSYEGDDGKVYYDVLNVTNVCAIKKAVKVAKVVKADEADEVLEVPVDEELPF